MFSLKFQLFRDEFVTLQTASAIGLFHRFFPRKLRFIASFVRFTSIPAYSFTCANGICENNCRSMIMFSRRSN
jgi:hypothetical protein